MKRTKKQKALERIWALCYKAVELEDYNHIRKAFDVAHDNDIFMAEDKEFVMIEDDLFYFDGAFGTAPRPEYY